MQYTDHGKKKDIPVKRVFYGISLSFPETIDWGSRGSDIHPRMPGRTCFITSLAFGVVTNSQIAFWPSRGEIITDHFLSQR
jgi:hypothetical protein